VKLLRWLLVVALAFLAHSQVNAEEKNPYSDFRVKTYGIQEVYLKEITQHQRQVMKDLEEKLQQQKWQTSAISIMVFIMVTFGLVLSAMQFYADFKSKGQSSVSLKLGAGSFEINSTVIGLAILAISFWFFQIYIDKVYSVSVFNIQPIDVTTFGVNK